MIKVSAKSRALWHHIGTIVTGQSCDVNIEIVCGEAPRAGRCIYPSVMMSGSGAWGSSTGGCPGCPDGLRGPQDGLMRARLDGHGLQAKDGKL